MKAPVPEGSLDRLVPGVPLPSGSLPRARHRPTLSFSENVCRSSGCLTIQYVGSTSTPACTALNFSRATWLPFTPPTIRHVHRVVPAPVTSGGDCGARCRGHGSRRRTTLRTSACPVEIGEVTSDDGESMTSWTGVPGAVSTRASTTRP